MFAPLTWGALAALLVAVVGGLALRDRSRILVGGAGAAAFLLLTALLVGQRTGNSSVVVEQAAPAAPAGIEANPAQPTDATRAAGLIETGARAFAEGRVDNARRAYSEADALYQRAGDIGGRADVAFARARMEEALGQPDAARTAYAGARDLYRRAGDPAGEAIAWAAMGDLERAGARFAAARTAYREARAAYARANGYVATEHVLLGFEEEAAAPNGADRARRRLADARSLYEQIADPAGLAVVGIVLGQLEQSLGNHPAALTGFRDAVAAYRAAADFGGIAEALTRIGLLDATYGYLNGAREALQEAVVTAATHDDPLGLAVALLVLGRVERLVGAYDASRETFLVAADVAEVAGDPVLRAEAILGAADADRLGGDATAAKAAYERAVAAFAATDPGAAGPALVGLAAALAARGDEAEAADAFAGAAELFRVNRDDRGEAMAHIQRGWLHLLTRPAEALEDFRRAFDPLGRLDSALGDAVAQTGAARAKQALGDAEGAAYGRGYARDALAQEPDPLREANRLLGLGLFGSPQFHDGAGAEAFARNYPRTNGEAEDLVQALLAGIAALPG